MYPLWVVSNDTVGYKAWVLSIDIGPVSERCLVMQWARNPGYDKALLAEAYVVNDGCDTHLLTSLLSALLAIRPTVAVLRPSSYKPVEHLMTQFPTTGIIHDSNRIRQRVSGEDSDDQMLLRKQVTITKKGQKGAFAWLSTRPWRNREDFERFVSSGIDIFKGWFITFMLVEHTRSSFHVGMDMTHWPVMHIFSKAACSLDMTCFSTAYGFMCYRSYLVNTKNRPLSTTLTRVFRSVGLVFLALIFMNITFSLSVADHMPAMREIIELITLSTVYWDFLAAFPLELLMGFLSTKPIIAFSMRYRHQRPLARLVLFAFLLGWPLVLSTYHLTHCDTIGERYLGLFVGCRPLKFRATRFPAIPYMFYFNFGCIVSQLLLEYSGGLPRASDISRRSHLPSSQALDDLSEVSTPSQVDNESGLPSPATSGTHRQDNFPPYLAAFALLLLVELAFLTPLAKNPQVDWEYLDWNGYVRFPMNYKVILAWGVLSHSVLIISMFIAAFMKDIPTVSHVIDFLEHCGANVLLYLVINSFIIHGMFHNHWVASGRAEDEDAPQSSSYSNFTWEIIVLAYAAGTMAATKFIHYLARTGRK